MTAYGGDSYERERRDLFGIQSAIAQASLGAADAALNDRFISGLARRILGKTHKPRAFLSYAHEDEQAVAGLASELRADGVEVWFAPADVRTGDRITRSIQKGIRRADFFLVAVTSQSRNSGWVAKEITFALRYEAGGLTIIPLILTSDALPELLSDHKAIDIRRFVYRAGLNQLLDRLHGRLSAGRTPLGEFERFVGSLPIFDDETQKAVDSYLLEYTVVARNPGLYRDKGEDRLESKLDACEKLISGRNYDSWNMERVLETLRLGKIPPALQASELEEVKQWLRVGRPSTLAIAARLYQGRFVRWPSYQRILKSYIQDQIAAWVGRGEIPQDSAPTPEWVIGALVDEQLVRPFRREEYVNEPTDDFQEFHWGPRLMSVGKAAYLYERDHPDRPHDGYPIDRFPGSTPSIV